MRTIRTTGWVLLKTSIISAATHTEDTSLKLPHYSQARLAFYEHAVTFGTQYNYALDQPGMV